MKPFWRWQDQAQFLACLGRYVRTRFFGIFGVLEASKSRFASQLYQKRGKYARPFIHSGMTLLVIAGVTLGPILIAETNPGLEGDFWEAAQGSTSVLAADVAESTYTFVSEKPRAETLEYEVQEGDTLSSIAARYGISVETIAWANNLASVKEKIKLGQKLKVLPTTGIAHQVKRGETVYSIAKKYAADAQSIVDWPYNTFANDENFALAVGQTLMVPDGVMPAKQPEPVKQYYAQGPTGGVVGTGQFAWPVGGRITQWYKSWHRAIDIADRSMPDVAAADSGTVMVAGWPSPWAYGNRVMIDHGNGYVTLYAHLNKIYVSAGQKVSRGQVLGQMGSTGRSTGPHLHFEIRKGGVMMDPMAYLK